MNRRVARRAQVELALMRGGGKVDAAELARAFGVSRWTIYRDVERVRQRFDETVYGDLRELHAIMRRERAGTADAFEMVARLAMEEFVGLAGDGGQHNARVGYLRTALDALDRRARLLRL